MLDVIKQAIEIWKHLRGEPPAKLEPVDGGQFVEVTNNNGQVIQVRTNSLNLVLTEAASNSAVRFIQAALQKDGMESLEIESRIRKLHRLRTKRVDSSKPWRHLRP